MSKFSAHRVGDDRASTARPWVTMGLLWLTVAQACVAGDVHDDLKTLWESTDSITFRSEETRLDSDGRTMQREEHEYALGRDGRSAVKVWETRQGTHFLTFDSREDGKKRYQLRFLKDHPNVIEKLTIQPQESTPGHYMGVMCAAAWAVIPGGRSLYEHLKAGAVIERERDEAGGEQIVLRTTHREKPLRCVLDPEHDWLVKKLDLEDSMELRLTQFGRTNGRWFPAAGESLQKKTSRVVQFRVTMFSFNDMNAVIKVSNRPSIPNGVQVVDQTTGKRQVQGGPAAKRAFTKRYPKPPPEAAAKRVDVVDSGDPFQVPWTSVILGGSISAIVAGLLLRLRGVASR